jgi:hypothetical protein
MTPETILAQPPNVLTSAQRQAYFRTGYLAAPGLIPAAWLRRLRELSAKFTAQQAGEAS